MQGKKLVFLALVIVLIAPVLAGCGATGAKKIVVATDATWAPFEFVDEKSVGVVSVLAPESAAATEEEGSKK